MIRVRELAENEDFLQVLRSGVEVTDSGHLQMPLPLKNTVERLPDNQGAVYYRAKSCLSRALGNTGKMKGLQDAMQDYIDRGHVEMVPLEERFVKHGSLAWWLLVFPVIHPLKSKVRLVFDAKAAFGGVSLNDILMDGPDLNNSLRGVLLRFRTKAVAF